jgi:hypothetical protein
LLDLINLSAFSTGFFMEFWLISFCHHFRIVL